MYQEHLHKVTLDKDTQKRKADDKHKNLMTQVKMFEAENQKLRTQIDKDKYVNLDLYKGYFLLCAIKMFFKKRKKKKYIYIYIYNIAIKVTQFQPRNLLTLSPYSYGRN